MEKAQSPGWPSEVSHHTCPHQYSGKRHVGNRRGAGATSLQLSTAKRERVSSICPEQRTAGKTDLGGFTFLGNPLHFHCLPIFFLSRKALFVHSLKTCLVFVAVPALAGCFFCCCCLGGFFCCFGFCFVLWIFICLWVFVCLFCGFFVCFVVFFHVSRLQQLIAQGSNTGFAHCT